MSIKATLIALFSLLFPSQPLLSPSVALPLDPSPTPTVTQVTTTIGLVGDLGLGRHITSIARTKNDFSWSFHGVSSWLLQNDFTLANLESPIIKNCPPGLTGTFTFCGDSRFLSTLSKHHFVFNLNNNHILNYGVSGLNQTKDYLSTDYFYDNFYTKNINDISFGFLGYDFITYSQIDTQNIINAIKTHKNSVDWLIISIHWGNEYLKNPENWRVKLARQLIDAGADIIHGHHPHVWQTPEIYQGKPIFYSFGNFIFDQSWSYATSHSQIARLTLTKSEIKSVDYFPIEIRHNSQPQLIPATSPPGP
jgi:poly-gamma-glutamate synthesis protein (capsule biosynthesis protein)